MIATLRARLSALTMLMLLLTAPLASNATMLVFDDRGLIAPVVVGATGVNVNGAIYDLTFISRQSMTCADIFSGCDGIDDFPFGVNIPASAPSLTQLGEIVAATAALQEQVLPLIVSSQFVEGCTTSNLRACVLQIPYSIRNTVNGSATVVTSQTEFEARISGVIITDANIVFETLTTQLAPNGASDAFVKFELVTPSPVPVPVPLPATLWLMGTALIGLVGVARRRRR